MRLGRVAVFLIVAAALACGRSSSPAQPSPLTDCTIFGVVVPSNLGAGDIRKLSAYLEHCRPMFLPLDPGQVSWQSADAAASVSTDSITAVARGPAVIRGTFARMTQEALVIVGANPAQPASSPVQLRIYGAPLMSVNQRAAFGAFALTADGEVMRVSSANWQSSSPAVAGLLPASGDAPQRLIDGFSEGTARITATYQGLSASMAIQVRQN